MSFIHNLVETGLGAAKSAVKIAAPIAATAVGGPAAGAAVTAGEKALSSATQKRPGGGTAVPARQIATPGSASSIGEARLQDRSRMKSQYGL